MTNSLSPDRDKDDGWLSGHPVIDPRNINPASQNQVTNLAWMPTQAETEAAVADARPIVAEAIAAIRSHAGDTVRRQSALNVLKSWHSFEKLTRSEIQVVINSFPTPAPRRQPGERECRG
jgi:hypothetical protein